jgi:hypothetical protein
MLFFFEIIQLLVAEKNTYYHQYLDTMAEGQCPLPGIMFRKHFFGNYFTDGA